jgi:hypothetical protein
MMAKATTFEQLCTIFARGLLDQARAFSSGELTTFQRSRLGDAISIELRKLGDMAFPAARAPYVSAAASRAAEAMDVDLLQHTWHSQKKMDGYQTFTYEHLFPVREIRAALGAAESVRDAMTILDDMLWVAWITKDEDRRLRKLGFASVRPDPWGAYEAAGIELLPGTARVSGPVLNRQCARCGERAATVLVTGGQRSSAPGRILLYCDNCREEFQALLEVVLPLDVVQADPAGILSALYRGGATRSDPDQVADMIGVPVGAWAPAGR